MTLSPGLHRSQVSSLTMTSMERGMEPAGTSFSFSCKRMRCQSPHLVVRLSPKSSQLVRFPQFRPGQMAGYVTLNCCSTPLTSRAQFWHLKVPTSSSGFISVVRVTVPHMVTSWPSLSVRRSRRPLYVGKSQKAATNLSSSVSRAFRTRSWRSGSSSLASSRGTAALMEFLTNKYFIWMTFRRSAGSYDKMPGSISSKWLIFT
mmetsp:Transcript_35159/g.64303  ORF Transcript_35159/g.64303 Transcript_35159/m.64303 type:complete len:203 (+) Transcript_35159:455-1063(+)